ncbi:MAG: phosphoglycerate mutase [Gammaproteobacteria bacterium HGW-Gammaproteobacteria-4]|jgi:phosphohistidine phosphatase SixA|nr:MAG: phosphoglycerate mutase [Gammaproteobacteria bacterium HGW-Gammaproteobacteria-4]
MRELILLRHAHAEPAVAGQSDIDRPLSPEGVAEAEAAAAWLKAHVQPPVRVVHSPARRTQETCARVLAALGYIDSREDARIYDATPGELFSVIDEHADAERLLLIGHNPGLEQVTALLSTGQTGDHRGLPPAGIVVLHIPKGSVLEPGVATMAAFWAA